MITPEQLETLKTDIESGLVMCATTQYVHGLEDACRNTITVLDCGKTTEPWAKWMMMTPEQLERKQLISKCKKALTDKGAKVCRACNSHEKLTEQNEKLLEALKALVYAVPIQNHAAAGHNYNCAVMVNALQQSRAAIALAEKQ